MTMLWLHALWLLTATPHPPQVAGPPHVLVALPSEKGVRLYKDVLTGKWRELYPEVGRTVQAQLDPQGEVLVFATESGKVFLGDVHGKARTQLPLVKLPASIQAKRRVEPERVDVMRIGWSGDGSQFFVNVMHETGRLREGPCGDYPICPDNVYSMVVYNRSGREVRRASRPPAKSIVPQEVLDWGSRGGEAHRDDEPPALDKPAEVLGLRSNFWSGFTAHTPSPGCADIDVKESRCYDVMVHGVMTLRPQLLAYTLHYFAPRSAERPTEENNELRLADLRQKTWRVVARLSAWVEPPFLSPDGRWLVFQEDSGALGFLSTEQPERVLRSPAIFYTRSASLHFARP